MGLFLTMLTCKYHSQRQVIKAIIKIAKMSGFILKSQKKVDNITGKINQFEVSNLINGWVQIFCPTTLSEKFSPALSKILNSPIFEFHIHEGVFWMYKLYISGELKDKYNPIPDYWEEMNENEKKSWRGNSSFLASHFKVNKAKIEPYLVEWKKIKQKRLKAFSEDEFPIVSEWSMVDFQKKIGIIYPEFDKPEKLKLIRLTFEKDEVKIYNNK